MAAVGVVILFKLVSVLELDEDKMLDGLDTAESRPPLLNAEVV